MDTTTTSDGRMDRRTFLGAGALAAAAALAGCTVRGVPAGETSRRRDWTFPAAEVDVVRVDSDVGDVTVVGRETDTVDVTAVARSWNGQRGLDRVDVTATVREGTLTVVSTVDGGPVDTPRTPRADVTVVVPAGTGGPDVDTVRTGAGEVTLTDTRGDTAVEAVAGAIVANRVDGYLSLRASAGRIEAADVTGLDEARTDLGRVQVELLGARGDVEISSGMGEVVVGVADDLDLDVLAEAEGRVSSDLDLTGGRARRDRVEGRLNDGGHRLHAVSEAGRVALRRIERRM
ncbi:hypothetical protein [Haloglomus litoreum]|uniref:hypothetical protein n=1 Tax=Haloglomus litoreum TaxID=3034026 RepID=UPI0023E8F7A0|nr:hypothetical protein [Haloglomus sp. DT116]